MIREEERLMAELAKRLGWPGRKSPKIEGFGYTNLSPFLIGPFWPASIKSESGKARARSMAGPKCKVKPESGPKKTQKMEKSGTQI